MRWVILLLLIGPAEAAENPAAQVRAQYERCAFNSIFTSRPGPNADQAAERALASCYTEEQAIIAYLSQSLPRNQVDLTVAGFKLRLKRELRKIAADLR